MLLYCCTLLCCILYGRNKITRYFITILTNIITYSWTNHQSQVRKARNYYTHKLWNLFVDLFFVDRLYRFVSVMKLKANGTPITASYQYSGQTVFVPHRHSYIHIWDFTYRICAPFVFVGFRKIWFYSEWAPLKACGRKRREIKIFVTVWQIMTYECLVYLRDCMMVCSFLDETKFSTKEEITFRRTSLLYKLGIAFCITQWEHAYDFY